MFKFKKSFISVILSLLIIATTIDSTTFAADHQQKKRGLADNVISVIPADKQDTVKPNTPIEITLNADKKVLHALGIDKNEKDKNERNNDERGKNESNKSKKDKSEKDKNEKDREHKDRFGVLITDGQNELLATESNGSAKVVYDKNTGTVQITVSRPDFTRYTNYNVYLLYKDALNKYQASLNSNKHSKSFVKMIEKERDKHLFNYSFKTGSAIGEASQWNLTQNKEEKILTTEGLTVTATAQDDYGDAAINGKLIFVNATDSNGQPLEGITATPTEAPLQNGKAEITVTSDRTQDAVLNFKTAGDYPEDTKTFSINAEFVKPVPEGSKITVNTKKNADGTIDINGNVQLNGSPVANVGVPLKVTNGALSDNLPVTDDSGNFEITLTKTNNEAAILSIDSSKAPNVLIPVLVIDPVIFGNQAWTDIGVDISLSNTLIRVETVGSWADNLYVKVGDNGTPVKVGANGGFVTGITGRLYLGPNNATYSDNVDSTIYIDDPKSIGINPTMSITANPTEIYADGKSTSAISGQVLYGQYPLVGGSVTLSTTSGTLDKTSAVTDDTGKYTATFTAGTTAGTAVVSGQFGNLNQSVAITLKDISSNISATLPKIAAGPSFALAVKNDGTVWGWGDNSLGQLGDGTYLNRKVPVQAVGMNDAIQVAASSTQSFILKKDGTVWYLRYWKLTTDSEPYTSAQIQGLTNIKKIATSPRSIHLLALKDDGTVWAFGNNQFGQLGIGSKNYVATGVQVKNLTDVKDIATSRFASFALKNDGTVWIIGNLSGSSYVIDCRQIKGLTNIVSIAAGTNFVVALRDDGTVWTWGYNNCGQLGDGTTSTGFYASPVQVKNLADVVQIAAGDCYALAVKDDGSIWAWGFNGYGQLGNGTTINSPVPVQVQNLNLFN